MDTPEQIAIARESKARHDAERLAKLHKEHEAKQEARARVDDAARNPHAAEQQSKAAAFELAKAKTQASQIDPADCEAQLAAAEAVARAAKTAFDIVDIRAQAAQVRALGDAGSDPVARAKAMAKAQSDWAETVGKAEADHDAASLAVDRIAVETFRARKIMAHRTRAAEARLAEREKAEADPLRLSNPFADPIRPVITESQFESIRDPALKARAAKEADIVPDDDPEFTKDDVLDLLRARKAGLRLVLTRSEFDTLEPAMQADAARIGIIVPD